MLTRKSDGLTSELLGEADVARKEGGVETASLLLLVEFLQELDQRVRGTGFSEGLGRRLQGHLRLV